MQRFIFSSSEIKSKEDFQKLRQKLDQNLDDVKAATKTTRKPLEILKEFPLENCLKKSTLKTIKDFEKAPNFHFPRTRTNLPSVTKILKETMSEEQKLVLLNWEKNMIAKLGLEGFEELKAANFRNGHQLHQSIENYFQDGSLISTEKSEITVQNLITSLSPIIGKIRKKTRNMLILEIFQAFTSFTFSIFKPKISYQCLVKFS